MHRIAHLDLQLLATTLHPHVSISQLAHQIQWALWPLAQSQSQGVLLAALLHRLFDVAGQTVESIGRAGALDALVGTLVVVMLHPVIQTLARIAK